jgi:Uma2 family endonuclease
MVAVPPTIPAASDQRIVMNGVTWAHFEAQLALRGDRSVPRMAYLQGAMELMSPSRDHERIKSYIGCLLEAYALDVGIEFSPYGGWTLKNPAREAGAEPDECYIIGADQTQQVPDLVIEVVWTSGGLDKLEIYRRLGVGEVWFWDEGRLGIHLLQGERYVRSGGSGLFPDLDVDWLMSFLDRPTASQAIRGLRAALGRSRRSRKPRRKR